MVRAIVRMFGCATMVAGMGLATGCGGTMPTDLGVTGGRLIACPSSPNCVSSFETNALHSIPALAIESSPGAAWSGLIAELESREDVEIESQESGYVHAVFTTSLMRYRDDVEFILQSNTSQIAVRSASRVGYGDMDANRNRIEALRETLAAKGLVRSGS